MCQAVQKCVHNGFGRCFSKWTSCVVRAPCCVFTIFFLMFVLLCKCRPPFHLFTWQQ